MPLGKGTATKKCCGCKQRFPSEQMIKLPAGNFHSMECAIEYGRNKAYKNKTKEMKAKYKPKPKASIKDEAQKAFNEYVRYRDKDQPCINTNQPVAWDGNESDAAHFISRAANNAMRFDLRNVHKATKASNKEQEKYIHDYRENLKERLGEARFKQFEADAKYWRTHQRNFSKEYLERVKRIFRKKKRVLMKIRGDK